jgi:hypothetical protein
MALADQLRTIFDQVLTPGRVLQDIPVQVDYYAGTEGGLAAFDPTTQTLTRAETLATPIDGVWTEPTERLIVSGDALRSDRFFYVSDLNLLRAGLSGNALRRAKSQDRIVYNGVVYHVHEVQTDAIQAVWVLHLRRP